MPVRERLIDLILEMRLRLLKHGNKEAHITEYGAAPESIDTLISVTKPKRSKNIEIGVAFSTQEEYAREVAIGGQIDNEDNECNDDDLHRTNFCKSDSQVCAK